MKTMLITGTSKGIGNYLANYYLENGFSVMGCSRTRSTIEHKNFTEFNIDISKEEDVKHMFSCIKELDILINNAGMASMNSSLLISYDRVKNVFDTNYMGTFLLCREAIKLMMKKRFGRIINFSTIAVPLNLEGESVYAASKSAIETFTRILSKEIAPFNITANIIG